MRHNSPRSFNRHSKTHSKNIPMHRTSTLIDARRRGRACRSRFATRLTLRSLAAIGLIAGLAAAGPNAARADIIGYTLSISSDYSLLQTPGAGNIVTQVKNYTAHQLSVEENNPVFKLTNDAMSSGLTEFTLSLNDPDSVVSALKILTGAPGSQSQAQSPFTNNIYGGPSNSIDIKLSTPLAPDASMFFMLQLAPANGYSDPNFEPGYQSILWPTEPGSSNADVSVTFNNSTDPTTNTIAGPLADLADFVANPDSMLVVGCCGNTSVLTNSMSGPTPPPTPEPASVALMVLGSLPIVVPVWRKRRRQIAARRAMAAGKVQALSPSVSLTDALAC